MVAALSAWLSRELARLSAARVWGLAFVYVLSAGLLIQLFILPVLLPSFHSGHGILAANDALSFHKAAAEMALQIGREGWGAWSLAPGGVASVSIMAAAYVFLPSEPWVILPLYAVLFATAAAALFAILRLCGFSRKAAGAGVVPLLLLPSTAMIYAVPHKDVFFVCGNMLFLYSILRLVVLSGWERHNWWVMLVVAFLIGLVGVSLVRVVRPYGVELMLGAGLIAVFVASVPLVFDIFRQQGSPFRGACRLLVLCLLVSVPSFITDGVFAGISSLSKRPHVTVVLNPVSEAVRHVNPVDVIVLRKVAEAGWVYSGVLPQPLEAVLQRVADTRNEYLFWHQNAKSAIDVSVFFLSAWDMVAYLPRALQIGLFAPFPTDWFDQGSLPVNTLMRRISAFEMILWYFLFPFFLRALLVRGRDRLAIGTVAVYAVSTIVIIALSLPNIGTLYRMRFGFWIMLFSVSVVMAVTMLEKRRSICVD